MSSSNFVESARSMIGTPFHWHGRIPGVGMDCVGLVVVAARLSGMDFEDVPRYTRGNQFELLMERLSSVADSVAEPWPGDVLVFCYGKDRRHLGICAGDTVIHCSSSPTVGGVIEEPVYGMPPIESIWRPR